MKNNSLTFEKLFKKYVDTCLDLFNITEHELYNNSGKRKVSDIKKIIILKFYKDKRNERDNVVNLLSNKFNCYHSNIVYLHKIAMSLFEVDIEFKNKFNLFEDTLNNS